ncbi:hypothetical protein IPA_09595 [Ignicoccus pacificus DSM 13166]|uniref:Uncharacterized protein n=1 Tax=Ignicoccus pacificus DSM 13166 TaxID=940294 RepID=A0A977KC55_9CREN|nr:hypothetical protein IPA_09595 [Ignicoccus pacificus DSM 13166]
MPPDFYELIRRFEPAPLDGEMLRFYVKRYEPDNLFEKLVYEKIVKEGGNSRVFVVGSYGLGKSTFLNFWRKEMDIPYPRSPLEASMKKLIPIVVKTVYDDNPQKFLYNLLKGLEKGFKKPGWIYFVGMNQEYEKFFKYITQVVENVLMRFEKMGRVDLDTLKSALGFIVDNSNIPVIFMVDGFAYSESFEQLAFWFDNLLQGQGKVSFIFTIIPDHLNSFRTRFPHVVSKFIEIRIPGYNAEETKKVFSKRLKDFATPENPFYPFKEEWIEEIWKHFPILRDTIKVAQRALTYAAKDGSLQKKHIELAIKEAERAMETTVLFELDELDRMILKALAELGEAGPSDVTRWLKKQGYDVAKSTVHYRLKEPLLKKGLVEKTPSSRGKRRSKYRVGDKRLIELLKYL